MNLHKALPLIPFAFGSIHFVSANEYKFEEIKFDQTENKQNIYEPKDKLDKFVGFHSEDTTSDDVNIFSAMQGLGYSDREIRIAIRDTKFEDNLSFEDKIKTLLQKIAEVS